MAKKKATDPKKYTERLTVKFNVDHVAATGPAIVGREGDEKTFYWTPQLDALIEDGTVEVVKKLGAAKREKATAKAAETS